ncbi:MAG TPA: aminotransferase class III-fold pyridoxal phosphate-dependent enzyme [Opitutaceae bacterium]|nr:aminotransferase class III-fold pyridoxal phosphate-dependent enzyme [Opitutaceae bacterium]
MSTRIFPGPISAKMIEELRRYVIADPYPFVMDIAKSEGMWIATVDGQRLFDWAGYYASKWIAHNHPRLFEPEYLRELGYAANNKTANVDFLTPQCLAFYRALHEVAPECMRGEKLEVYAVNSGAEAVENMMKYLINLHDQKRRRDGAGRHAARRFIYFDQAFHGRTVFALNVTELSHDPLITRDFHGLVRGNIQVPFPAVNSDDDPAENRFRTNEALQRVERSLSDHRGEIVGIIVEPIQGAGGHRVAEKEFFQGLSRLAHDHGVSLGFDEVQTAGGQTGKFFMADQLDLPHPPQAIAAAKKMGTGVLYMRQSMADEGVLDSTWGGTLADMVRFVQELKIVREEKLIEQVPEKAERLVQRLKALQAEFPEKVSNIRGAGLYQGFSLSSPVMKTAVIDAALEQEQLLLLGAGRTNVRLRPNLNVTADDIDLLQTKLRKVLENV